MADRDTLIQNYKDSHPGASDEEAIQGLLALMPKDLNTTPSRFDVNTSDTTVPMNGNQPTVIAPTMPPPQPSEISNTPVSTTEEPKTTIPTPVLITKQPEETAPVSDMAKSLASTSFSADNAKREAMLAANEKNKSLGLIPIALAGIGDTISNTSAPFGGKPGEEQMGKVVTQLHTEEESRKKEFEDKLKNDPMSDVSKSYREMVLKIAPDLAGNKNFENMSAMAIGDKLPLIDTMIKAQAAKDAKEMGLKNLEANKNISLGLREDQQQDRLEQQAMQRLSALRGDQSLARIENQRDAAISAYRTIDSADKEKRTLSQAEYYDVLGQLWKARTGASPSDAAIKDLDSKTFQGNLQKAATYFTGKPMGATTPEVLKNLKQFVAHTGELADEQHDAYMKPHLIKPTGLKEDRWNPIVKTNRGLSFDEATKNKTAIPSQHDPLGIL